MNIMSEHDIFSRLINTTHVLYVRFYEVFRRLTETLIVEPTNCSSCRSPSHSAVTAHLEALYILNAKYEVILCPAMLKQSINR